MKKDILRFTRVFNPDRNKGKGKRGGEGGEGEVKGLG